MTYQEAVKRAKSLTMACWWKNARMGRTSTDWIGVLGELRHEADASLRRGEPDRAGVCMYLVKRLSP